MNKLLLLLSSLSVVAHVNIQAIETPNLPIILTNDNAVVSVVELRNDTILVFKNRGYYIVDNANPIDPNFFDEENLVETPFISKVIKQNDSIVWMWGNGELYQYLNKNVTPYNLPFSSSVEDIVCDSKNNLWFATWGGGVYMYNGNVWVNFSQVEGLVDHRVTSLSLGENDRIWLGYHMSGIGYIESGKIVNINEGSYNNPFDVSDIVLNDSDVIVSAWSGLYKYSSGKLSLVYDRGQLRGITVDQNDSLWISTLQDGVFRVKLSDLGSMGTEYVNVLTGNINNVLIDSNNNKWIATLDGLQHGTDKWILYYKLGLCNDRIQNIVFNNSQKWICTYTGLCMLEKGQWYNFNDNHIKGNIVMDIAFIGDDIWVLTQEALLKCSFNETTKELSVLNRETLSFAHSSLTVRDGKLYVSTWGDGIAYQTASGWQTLKEADGLANNYVYTIMFQNNVMWIVTLKGITRIENNVIDNYIVKTDLPVNYVQDMTIDTDGTPWFISTQGLLKYVNDDFIYFAHNSGSTKIQADTAGNILVGGMIGFYIYDKLNNELVKISTSWESEDVRSISLDENGKIWVGLYQGVRTNADLSKDILTNMPDKFNSEQISVYPNPVKGDLIVDSEIEIVRYEIYASTGQCIKVGKGNVKQIDFSLFTSGIYLVKLHTDQHIILRKIIKK